MLFKKQIILIIKNLVVALVLNLKFDQIFLKKEIFQKSDF